MLPYRLTIWQWLNVRKCSFYFANITFILKFVNFYVVVGLKGVEICGEKVFEVTAGSSEKYKWDGHGFQLIVHNGALPPGITASVAVRSIVAGPFKFPENSELISAIYWISSTHACLLEEGDSSPPTLCHDQHRRRVQPLEDHYWEMLSRSFIWVCSEGWGVCFKLKDSKHVGDTIFQNSDCLD